MGEELLAVFHQDCDAIYLCLRRHVGTLFTCLAPCADEPGSPAVAERLRQLVDQRCGYHDGLLLGDDRAKATFRVAIEQAEDDEEGRRTGDGWHGWAVGGGGGGSKASTSKTTSG